LTITRSKDLWAGNPVWLSYPYPFIEAAPLTKNIKTDVAVIGAGVSGATVAQALAEAGYSVVILDKRPPGCGSTSASTALLQYDLDQPLIKLADEIGHENATRAWLRSKRALDRLTTKTKELQIDCDFQLQDTLYLTGNILDADEMWNEARARNAIGLTTDYLDRVQLRNDFGIEKSAALRTENSVSVNPLKFTAGYLEAAQKRGAQLFSPVEVRGIQIQHNSVVLQTAQGFEITTRYVVAASGYEILKEISLKKKQIVSSWAMATKPQSDKIWPGAAHIWEASDPYLYIRATDDGRVLCGGEDEEFSDEDKRNALLPEKIKTLERKLKDLLPDLDTHAEFSWCGCFGETETSLPMIGPVPGLPNCFAVLAFGGNGITFSHIAAEMLLSYIQGNPEPESDLFRIQ